MIAGRYRLERRLGEGGMGAVWAATHTVTGRSVALKFVRGPAHARAEMRRRLLREARAASAVAHPNVVEVLDAFEHDEETPVMVMELLTGETLRERIDRKETLSMAETAALLLPVISAVGAAHARGVVHRDLKPDNIFLTDTAVRVLDFGIAKLAEPEPGMVTQTGSTVGTPCYMAPEQALGERDVDHRADIWALGVILYECLSGVRPIEGETVGQVVMHLVSTGITPLEHVALGVPSDVAALVGRMLSRERTRRPGDLREVADTLARFGDAAAPSFEAPRASKKPIFVLLGAAAALALLALTLRDDPQPAQLSTFVTAYELPASSASSMAPLHSASAPAPPPPIAKRTAKPAPSSSAPAGLAEKPPF